MQLSRLLLLFALYITWVSSFGQDDSSANKSVIGITEPNQSTVWSIPQKISLSWNTENIDASKSLRFFLVRNEMVVQELGSFKNDGFEDGIDLAKNIGSGDRYQVVAIELFPDNKYSIAKKITPFFKIINKASDERKRKQQTANVSVPPRKSKGKTNNPIANNNTAAAPEKRENFEGRKISYTQEMQFDSENISIKIWDHGRQDGDIVSIYLNGEPIVSKYYLTYWKKEFKVKLDVTKANDLFLYAHNLGKAPPNTVSVEISDNTKSENIILNSDLQSCEAVMISVR